MTCLHCIPYMHRSVLLYNNDNQCTFCCVKWGNALYVTYNGVMLDMILMVGIIHNV